MSKKKKLRVGDLIRHTVQSTGDIRTGTVHQMLSTQFTYKADNGELYFCFYNESWKMLEN